MNEKLSHPLHNPSYADIIIVGGGLSGLAAATYAAKSGRTVTLFEKASEPGGRAITKQHNGFSLKSWRPRALLSDRGGGSTARTGRTVSWQGTATTIRPGT